MGREKKVSEGNRFRDIYVPTLLRRAKRAVSLCERSVSVCAAENIYIGSSARSRCVSAVESFFRGVRGSFEVEFLVFEVVLCR